MSGIDEVQLRCPHCYDWYDINESPSFWQGRTDDGKTIWLISDSFAELYPLYGNHRVVFSNKWNEKSSESFALLTKFTCGWNTPPEYLHRDGLKRWSFHTYNKNLQKDAGVFNSILSALEDAYRKNGGVYIY